jgi:hypothetical protein
LVKWQTFPIFITMKNFTVGKPGSTGTTSQEEAMSALGAEMRAYWQRLRGERAMPSRAHVDPADIPKLLPNVLAG